MRLVIAAFTTLDEADRAAAALLEAGFDQQALAAVGQAGGGRLLLAGRVPVHWPGDPPQLLDRSERATGSAIVAALGVLAAVALVLWLGPRLGVPLGALGAAGTPLWPRAAVAMGLAALGGLLAALARSGRGLPHPLVVTYGRRLELGDTILGVRVGGASQAASARETLAMHGAILAQTTRGTLEPAFPAETAPFATPSRS
jgi:hypothetical protein